MRRALLVAVVFVVVSCGGEGRSADRAPASPDGARTAPRGESAESVDRDAFVRAVNAACRDYAERDEALESPEGLDEYVPFMRAWIGNSAGLDAKLADLDAPPLVEGFGGYVADNHRQTELLRAALPELEAAVREDDTAEADAVLDGAIDDFNEIVDELDPYAKRYGFTGCAGGEE